jgi:hypothetical protein
VATQPFIKARLSEVNEVGHGLWGKSPIEAYREVALIKSNFTAPGPKLAHAGIDNCLGSAGSDALVGPERKRRDDYSPESCQAPDNLVATASLRNVSVQYLPGLILAKLLRTLFILCWHGGSLFTRPKCLV